MSDLSAKWFYASLFILVFIYFFYSSNNIVEELRFKSPRFQADGPDKVFNPPAFTDLQIQPKDVDLIQRAMANTEGHQIVFDHFFKTGGHGLCQIADKNDEKIVNKMMEAESWIGQEQMAARMSPKVQQDVDVIALRDKFKKKSRKSFNCEGFKISLLQSKSTFVVRAPWISFKHNCTYRELEPRMTLSIVLVRHPVSRLGSYAAHMYRYLRLNLIGTEKKLSDITPQELMDLPQPMDILLDNYQVRRIVDKLPTKHVPKHETYVEKEAVEDVTESDLEYALSLSNSIDIVIPTERLCEASIVFETLFGWDPATIPNRPQAFTNAAKKLTTLTPTDDLLYTNRFDVQLWEYANRRFDELLIALGRFGKTPPSCPAIDYHYLPLNEMVKVDENDGTAMPGQTADDTACTKMSLTRTYESDELFTNPPGWRQG